ncbi:MAG: thioredoxin family protein [Woeseiaceae bacterium]|nr:thioredoxin family protein [Woeseiaceae bacterium]
MAAVESQMLELGTSAPAFSLPDPDGNVHALPDDGNPLLVMFICNHCPFVVHVREALAALATDYPNVNIVAINSNDAEAYPADAPDKMKLEAVTQGYTFPYLFDEDQSVAKAYRAACTPDFFLFDGDLKLVYRGQLDDSRPSNGKPVTGKDLRAAMDAVLAARPVSTEQAPSIGCNIKWKPGNAPDYFG